MLKVLSDRIIIDGHEPTREQCETMTLLANALERSKDFRRIEYKNGYAEFEKIGRTEELRFVPEQYVNITVNFDSNAIEQIAIANSGGFDDTVWTESGTQQVFGTINVSVPGIITLKEGYTFESITGGIKNTTADNKFNITLTKGLVVTIITSGGGRWLYD